MPESKENKISTFLSILDTWPEYFETMDEGMGTTYERFILHRYFREIKDAYQINSVLEAPGFGMTGVSGINSLWWAKEGVAPIVVDTNEQRIAKSKQVWDGIPLPVKFQFIEDFNQLPFDNKAFDFSWNFASLWFVNNLGLFLTELERVTRKVIFICVPNRSGIGYRLRSFFNKEKIDNFYPDNIKSSKIVSTLTKSDWRLMRSGYLDIPPWPDIAMKKEDMLKKAGLGFLIKKKKNLPAELERTCIVDYFKDVRPELENQILKYAFLEKAPFPIKQLWGHHRYFIFVNSHPDDS
jgi:hypothetical protein